MTTDSIPQTTPAVPAPVAPGIPDTVARLRQTFATGRTRSVEWRKQQLKAIEKMMTENEAAIIEALAADHGRGAFESWMTDVAPVAAEAHQAAKSVRRWMRRRYRMLEMSQLPGRGWVEYEPYGTVLIIGAWNFHVPLTFVPRSARSPRATPWCSSRRRSPLRRRS
jgi:aldehyde dehydrogenase (NAD+)